VIVRFEVHDDLTRDAISHEEIEKKKSKNTSLVISHYEISLRL
jgi:hypothetical protein